MPTSCTFPLCEPCPTSRSLCTRGRSLGPVLGAPTSVLPCEMAQPVLASIPSSVKREWPTHLRKFREDTACKTPGPNGHSRRGCSSSSGTSWPSRGLHQVLPASLAGPSSSAPGHWARWLLRATQLKSASIPSGRCGQAEGLRVPGSGGRVLSLERATGEHGRRSCRPQHRRPRFPSSAPPEPWKPGPNPCEHAACSLQPGSAPRLCRPPRRLPQAQTREQGTAASPAGA